MYKDNLLMAGTHGGSALADSLLHVCEDLIFPRHGMLGKGTQGLEKHDFYCKHL